MLKQTKIYTVLILFLISMSFTACEKQDNKIHAMRDSEILKVQVQTPQLNPYLNPLTFPGIIKADLKSSLASQISGIITYIGVEEGSPVKSGQIVVRLDDREQRINVGKLEAQLMGLGAEDKELIEKVNETTSKIQLLFHEQESILSQQDLAQKTFNRYKTLLAKEVVSQQEFDTVKSDLDQVNAKVNKSQDEYAILLTRKKQLEAQKEELIARIREQQANIANAKVNLSYAQIVTLINGVVTGKLANVGDMAVPGKPLVTIENSNSLYLELNIDENQTQALKVGSKVFLFVDAFPQKRFLGVIREIAPSADPKSHTFVVKVAIKPTGLLHSGMYAKAIFNTQQESLFVPHTAVIRRGEITGVYIVDSRNIARFVIVKFGEPIEGFVPVLAGLTENDKVIISDPELVKDGSKVNVSRD